MKTIDLIIVWPCNNDYPIWRDQLGEWRFKFNKVFIVFMKTYEGHDYSPWIKQIMDIDDITFIDPVEIPKGGDWRDASIKEALRQSTADYVYFTEQDFFYRQGYWNKVDKYIAQGFDYIGVKDKDRLHPCSLFILRSALNKTRLNFGIVPEKLDHFGMIQQDIEHLDLEGYIMPHYYYYHMNGLSHNFTLLSRGEKPNYHAGRFRRYLSECLDADVALNRTWLEVVVPYLEKCGNY